MMETHRFNFDTKKTSRPPVYWVRYFSIGLTILLCTLISACGQTQSESKIDSTLKGKAIELIKSSKFSIGKEDGGLCDSLEDVKITDLVFGTVKSPEVLAENAPRIPALYAKQEFTCVIRLFGRKDREEQWVILGLDEQFQMYRCLRVGPKKVVDQVAEECDFMVREGDASKLQNSSSSPKALEFTSVSGLVAGFKENEIPAPVLNDVISASKACEDSGGKSLPMDNVKLLQITDITGDGLPDYIIRTDAIYCEGSVAFLGNSGGSVTIYARTGDVSVVKVFGSPATDLEIKKNGSSSQVYIGVSGELCGQKANEDTPRSDLRYCSRPLKWNSELGKMELAPIEGIQTIKQ
ncbi:hypothetical protein [Hydrogenophaga defluvii]|uniref:Lipoprotein n=1 Tax=Hydrogenophaga defluvii TaxID=249410 RepID=A0ABW2SBK1_9BURK